MTTHATAATATTNLYPLPGQSQEVRMSLTVAGSQMSLLTVGEGHAVILAHSYLWDAEMWRPQIEALSSDYRVIVPELWGHGSSGDLPAGTTTLCEIARHHLAAFDQLGLETFTLIGLSVGAMWAAELALIAPHRVRGLVLMDSFMGPEPEASRLRYEALLNAVEATGRVSDPLLDAVVPLFFSPAVSDRNPVLPDRFRARLAHWDPGPLKNSVVPLGRMIFGRRDGLEDLRALQMPALVISGADDLSRPPHEGRRMADVLRCRYVEIEGAGHISSLEAPQAVIRALQRFLASAAGPVDQQP